MAKSRLLQEKEKIEALGTVPRVQSHRSQVNPDKWNKLAYGEILNMCDKHIVTLRQK